MGQHNYRPHQRRAFTILQMAEPTLRILPEVGIPQSSWQIDAIFQVGAANGSWGCLVPLVTHRELVVEHYRATPQPVDYTRALAKHAWRCDQWLRSKESFGQRPPALLILSGGRPRRLLAFDARLSPWGPSGMYLLPRSTGDVVLIDTKNLARCAGTSVFRMTRVPQGTAEAEANCSWLLADPSVPTLIASSISEFVVSTHTDTAAFPEGKLQVQLWYEGRETGRKEGRETGRDEGRRLALLELVSELCPERLEELERLGDLDQLRREVASLLSPSP